MNISKSSLNEQGITLQTIIITAVLALAAVGAGIVIYNFVASEADDIVEIYEREDALRDSDPDNIPVDVFIPELPEIDESQFTRYQAERVCMHIEVPYWGQIQGSTLINTQDYIQPGNSFAVLSPIRTNMQGNARCEYASTANAGFSSDERIWANSSITGRPVVSCESSHNGLVNDPADLAYFNANPFCTMADANLERDQWKLISFCSSPKLDNSEVFVSFSLYSSINYEYNGCAYREGNNAADCSTDDAFALYEGFSVGFERGYCFAVVSSDSDGSPLPEALPSGDGCLNWKSESLGITEQGTLTGDKCTYPFATSECADLGLKVDASTCAYEPGSYARDSNPSFSSYLTTQCLQSQYVISLNTGDARCEWNVGNIPPQWLQVCEGWHQVAADEEAADAGNPDNTKVFVLYDVGKDLYQCILNNVHYDTRNECLSFGYVWLNNGNSECAYLGLGYYNPKPIAPSCMVRRLVPYSYAYASDAIGLPFTAGISDSAGLALNEADSLSDAQINILREMREKYAVEISIPAPAVEAYPAGNLGVSRDFYSPGSIRDTILPNTIELSPSFANSYSLPQIGTCEYSLQYYEAAAEAKSKNSDGDNILTIAAPRDSAAGRCGYGETSENGPANYWLPRYFTGVIATGAGNARVDSDDDTVAGCEDLSSSTACGARRSQPKGYYHLDCAVEGSDTKKVLDGAYAKECMDLGFSRGTKIVYDWKKRHHNDNAGVLLSETAHPAVNISNAIGFMGSLNGIVGSAVVAGNDSNGSIRRNSIFRHYGSSPDSSRAIEFLDGNGASSSRYLSAAYNIMATDRSTFSRDDLLYEGFDTSFAGEMIRYQEDDTIISSGSIFFAGLYEATEAFLPVAEAKCSFVVSSSTAEANEIAWLKACRNLDALFDVRLSYYKPVVWGTNTDVIKAAVESHYFDSDDSYDAADAANEYSPPSYFHVDTSSTDGQYYCEVSPTTSSDTARTQNCNAINAVLGLSPTAVAALGQQSLAVQSSSRGLYENGFFYYEEGPRDHYTCKWKAPSAGNFLV